ncbi:MAG: (5-formylfuran-3-yl)methyl phosphate synthase [Candidatus Nanohaloarchaea archaeon]
MKSLVTVKNAREAETVSEFDPDIVDIKNPDEGSLGAPSPSTLESIMDVLPEDRAVSVAVGDVPDLPGTVGMAVQGASQHGPEYVKVGLKGPRTKEDAVNLMRVAAEASGENQSIVLAGYADYREIDGVSLLDIPDVAVESGVDGVMVDTAVKGEGNLFEHADREVLKKFVSKSSDRGFFTAAAGSLSPEDVGIVRDIGFDVIGVRGAICSGDSRSEAIDSRKLEEFLEHI